MWYQNLLEANRLPDWLIRKGIRYYNHRHAQWMKNTDPATRSEQLALVLHEIAHSPIAAVPEKANEQHYELPAQFFHKVLGPHLKYSCGFWPQAHLSLEASETAMLELSCQRAGLKNGDRILELGCGWGSLSLWMAKNYPDSAVTVLSNSQGQRAWIEAQAESRNLNNLTVITVDINHFDTDQRFDRIVSVEMFEHLRNYPLLFERISSWLNPDGTLFVHIFGHYQDSYFFVDESPRDWMARYFFSGGTMPAKDLLPTLCQPLELDKQWTLSGRHYQRTAEAWLALMDAQKKQIMPLLSETYGEAQSLRWWVYWRVFFMAVSELFGYQSGEVWQVYHYRFKAPQTLST